MTDVPEHLLQRSRDRRAALGLGGGGDAAAPAESAAPAAGGAPATATPSTPAAAPAAPAPAPEPLPPAPPPPYVAAAMSRKRMPVWVLPVIAFLPLWGWMYASTLSQPESDAPGELAAGAEVYAACAGCHGAGGGGGTGRQLSGGEVLATFPDIAQQIEFVAVGSEGIGEGNVYGDPERPGGAHTSGSFGNMPAFIESLSQAELFEVVRHERETLSGEEVEASLIGPDGELLHENGQPWLVDGVIVDENGEPLLDEEGYLVNPPGGGAGGGDEVAASG